MRAALLGSLAGGALSTATWIEGFGTFADGNRTLSVAAGDNGNASTPTKTGGNWYAEVKLTGGAVTNSVGFVLQNASYNTSMVGNLYSEWGLVSGAAGKGVGSGLYNGGGQLVAVPSYQSGDVVMLAINMTTGSMWWGLNGSWLAGNPGMGTGAMGSFGSAIASMFMACTLTNTGLFGGSAGAFTIIDQLIYQPPSGFDPM